MIKNIIKNDRYEMNIKDKYIHIKNYININDISLNRISILIKDKILIINGSNLIIRAMDEYEILINGYIRSIEFNNE